MWHSIELELDVVVRFDLDTLTEGGTVAHCAIVLPNTKVIDLGTCRIKVKYLGDGNEKLRLVNIESGLRFYFERSK